MGTLINHKTFLMAFSVLAATFLISAATTQAQSTATDASKLVSPAANGHVLPDKVEFQWQPISNAVGYELTITPQNPSPQETSIVREVIGSDRAKLMLDRPLKPNQTYTWTVTAILAGQRQSLGTSTFKAIAVELLTPKDGETINPGASKLSWTKVPQATGYTVEISLGGKEFYEVISYETLQEEYTLDKHSLVRGKPYFWRVNAKLNDGSKITSAPRTFMIENFLQELHDDYGLTLRRSFSKEEKGTLGTAATFALTLAKATEDSYSLDSFLEWQSRQEDSSTFSPYLTASIEAHISDAAKAPQNSIRLRLGPEVVWNFNDKEEGLTGLWILAPVKYETDRHFDEQKITFEPEIIPNFTLRLKQSNEEPGLKYITFGESFPILSSDLEQVRFPTSRERRHGIWLMFMPSFGAQLGKTMESAGDENEIARLTGRLQSRFYFYDIAHALTLTEVAFFTNYKAMYLGISENGAGVGYHNLLETGLEFGITDNLTLLLSYKRGEDSPTFVNGESFNIAVGLRF